jgi:hypothetical protein
MNPTKSLSVGAKLLPLLLLLSSIPSWAQQLEVFNPPTSTGNTQAYTDLFSVVLPKATHLNGMTVLIPWGTVDTGESAPCQETTQVKNCDWPAIEQQLLAYINGPNNDGFGLAHYPGTKLNLIIVLVPEAGPNGGYQNVVPQYVFNAGTYSNWCPSCSPTEPQDVVTCANSGAPWPGDLGGPTCSNTNSAPPANEPCTGSNVNAGVWNSGNPSTGQAPACHLTGKGNASCYGSNNFNTMGGFPVLYETPIMTAYQQFIETLLFHYSTQGLTTNGRYIGSFIGYIRVGLAQGGENLPTCTVEEPGGTGIWPSPNGLSHDMGLGVYDWYKTSTTCTGNCQGKYAYLNGDPNQSGDDGPGYVAAMYEAFMNPTNGVFYYFDNGSFPNLQLMSNSHAGPPFNSDLGYADTEASIFAGLTQEYGEQIYRPPYAGQNGFGMEALSEYDVFSLPVGRPCGDDWCANFATYWPSYTGGNQYLQTETPNLQATYSISSVSTQTNRNGIVTCSGSSNCTNFSNAGDDSPDSAGAQPSLLYSGEGFALSVGSGQKASYKIGQILTGTTFSCDPATPCPQNLNQQTLWQGDYLPDTIPFALNNYADTLEIYFCDWDYALNKNSGTNGNGCQAYDATYSPLYLNVLNNP